MDEVELRLSYSLCVKLANDAVKYAVLLAPKFDGPGGGKGARGLYPIAKPDGTFGIGIRSWAYYMVYQNLGIKPFTMWSLEGKTIPIRLPGGKVIFRKATNVGQPGRIAKRDEKGRILPGNVGVKWRHPGLKPKNFIEEAMGLAVKRYQKDIEKEISEMLLREMVGQWQA